MQAIAKQSPSAACRLNEESAHARAEDVLKDPRHPLGCRGARPRGEAKVVCYIVRDGQLLVFKHLDEEWDESGLQVPAGSIIPGETPEDAAVREASEETGLTALRLVRKVGESEYDMTPYRSETHHRHLFHLEVDEVTPDRWVTSEDDPDDGSGPKRFECYWIPLVRGHALSAGQGALLGHL